MPEARPSCLLELCRQMVELVRAGGDPTDLAREFEPSARAIWSRVAEADRREGRACARSAGPAAEAGLGAAGREGLARLRREAGVLPPGSPGSCARAGPPSLADAALLERVRAVHATSRET